MTDKLREAAQMALEALQESKPIDIDDPTAFYRSAHAIEALRAALAQPEQEPVACPYCHYSHTLGAVFFDQNCAGCVKRMTAPPQREWQGLTDEERQECLFSDPIFGMAASTFASAIEAKLKEKNT